MRQVRLRLPLTLVRVAGPSMVPTLKHGDVALVRRSAAIRPNDVVLAEFRELPGRLVLKRAHRRMQQEPNAGWDLRSDNEFAGGDSRTHGLADVHGRVVLVWHAGATGLRRLGPQRVR